MSLLKKHSEIGKIDSPHELADTKHEFWKTFDIKKMQVNMKYLIGLTVVMSLSSMQFGIVLATDGNVFKIIKKQLFTDKTDTEQETLNTILQSCSVIGLGIGSLLGGTMLGNGKRSKIINYNIVGLCASSASLYLNFNLICIARFIHGFSTGILVNACPKMIEETVPSHVMDYGFGTSTNLSINVAIMISLLLGLGLPPESEYGETKYWMVFYASAIPMYLIALVFNLTVFKYDSISFHAKH